MKFLSGKIRIFLMVIAVAGFLCFALPLSLSVSLNIGNVTGMAVAALLFTYALFLPGVHRIFVNWSRHKRKKWLVRGILGFLFLIVFFVVIESACMISAVLDKPEAEATVVVLGCRVYGEKPSLSMVERLDAAYEYLTENEKSVCVLSGGKGDGENISEAECMYRYLTGRGIDPSRLYKEEQSTSTKENLSFSKKIIEQEGLNPAIAIATSEYHAYRAGRIARTLGFSCGTIPGHTGTLVISNVLCTRIVRYFGGVVFIGKRK